MLLVDKYDVGLLCRLCKNESSINSNIQDVGSISCIPQICCGFNVGLDDDDDNDEDERQ